MSKHFTCHCLGYVCRLWVFVFALRVSDRVSYDESLSACLVVNRIDSDKHESDNQTSMLIRTSGLMLILSAVELDFSGYSDFPQFLVSLPSARYQVPGTKLGSCAQVPCTRHHLPGNRFLYRAGDCKETHAFWLKAPMDEGLRHQWRVVINRSCRQLKNPQGSGWTMPLMRKGTKHASS